MALAPHDKLPERPDGWRVGDVVVVRPGEPRTELGEGVIVDVLLGTEGYVKQALVRFEDGPAKGVWYGTPLLIPVRDLEGRPLTPTGRYAVPTRRPRVAEGAARSQGRAAQTRTGAGEGTRPHSGLSVASQLGSASSARPRTDAASAAKPKTRRRPDAFLRGRDLLQNQLMEPGEDVGLFLDYAFAAQQRGDFKSMRAALTWAAQELEGDWRVRALDLGLGAKTGESIPDIDLTIGAYVRVTVGESTGDEGTIRSTRGRYLFVERADGSLLACLPSELERAGLTPASARRGLVVGTRVRVRYERSTYYGKEGTILRFDPPYVVLSGITQNPLHQKPEVLEAIPEPSFPGAKQGFALGSLVKVIDPRSGRLGKIGTVKRADPPHLLIEGLGGPPLHLTPAQLEVHNGGPDTLFGVGAKVRINDRASPHHGKVGTVSRRDPPYLVIEGIITSPLYQPTRVLELVEPPFPGADRGLGVGVKVRVVDTTSAYQGLVGEIVKATYPYVVVADSEGNRLAFRPQQLDLGDGPTQADSPEADPPATKADSPASEADSPATEADSPAPEADPPAPEADSPATEVDSTTDAASGAEPAPVGEALAQYRAGDRARVVRLDSSVSGKVGVVLSVQAPFVVLAGLGVDRLFFKPSSLHRLTPVPANDRGLSIGMRVRVCDPKSGFYRSVGIVEEGRPPYVVIAWQRGGNLLAFLPKQLEVLAQPERG